MTDSSEKLTEWKELLQGGDLRSLADSEKIIAQVSSQPDFNLLFSFLYDTNRLVVMRAADVIEKLTTDHPEYLYDHKLELIHFLDNATEKEFKWHLAQLIVRVSLDEHETDHVWNRLKQLLIDQKESKIVRVNALQSLHELCTRNTQFVAEFQLLLKQVESENIPSIIARVKKLNSASQ